MPTHIKIPPGATRTIGGYAITNKDKSSPVYVGFASGNNMINYTPFQRGQRLRMTARAIEQRLGGPKKRTTGVVIGFSRDGRFLRVRRDGSKYSETYSPQWWVADDA
jgi:hypothetical protein